MACQGKGGGAQIEGGVSQKMITADKDIDEEERESGFQGGSSVRHQMAKK